MVVFEFGPYEYDTTIARLKLHSHRHEYEYGSGFLFMARRSFGGTSGTFMVTCTSTYLNTCRPY